MQDLLKKIQSARYGKEVREPIAGLIEEIYAKLTDNKDGSKTNQEVVGSRLSRLPDLERKAAHCARAFKILEGI